MSTIGASTRPRWVTLGDAGSGAGGRVRRLDALGRRRAARLAIIEALGLPDAST